MGTCVVAGGGPAGMVLGLLLARAGVEVTVLEKHADFLRDFRGDTVHASTLRLLDELGLGPAFAAIPHSEVDRVTMPAPDGGETVLGDMRLLPGRHQHVAMVPQWDLLDLLAATAAAEPTFHLMRNTEVTGVVRARGRVVGVSHRDSETGATGELRADLVVAADGRWSVLRKAAGLRPREFSVPFDTWWVRVPREETELADRLSIRQGDRDLGLAIPRRGYFQLAYIGRKGADAELRAAGGAAFAERVVRMYPELADRKDQLADLDGLKLLDVKLNRLRRWFVPGLLCIGDAAHAMSPAGGVGINLAVQDAVSTATLLARPLRRGRVGLRHLALVQARRWPSTVIIQGLQRLLHRGLFGPAVNGQVSTPKAVRVFRAAPRLRIVPSYLIGIGPFSAHAPAFARRPEPHDSAKAEAA
jgi:2-polyprenyl-6-methoxyphenol hydroxylase-like FAD-dependent oxidoreductase